MGFEKALGAVKVIKGQTQYRSQRLLNQGQIGTYNSVVPGLSEPLF